MPITGASGILFFSAQASSSCSMLDQLLDGVVALDLFVGMAPQLGLDDPGLGEVGRLSSRLSSTTPARMLVPPTSTARMPS